MIHLDTNFLSGAAFEDSAVQGYCRDWLRRGDSIATSCIAWAEFLNGRFSALQIRRVKNLLENRIISFDVDEAETASLLYTRTGRRRGSMADCMIASTAICAGVTLATLDRRGFNPFVPFGLKLA